MPGDFRALAERRLPRAVNMEEGASVRGGMRPTILGSLLALPLLFTSCAVHARPVETVVVEKRAPHPAKVPVKVEKRRPMPRLSKRAAVKVAESYCDRRRYDCRLDHAHLTKGGEVWKVHFDARSWRAKGKVFVEVDARTGRILQAKETGRLTRRHA